MRVLSSLLSSMPHPPAKKSAEFVSSENLPLSAVLIVHVRGLRKEKIHSAQKIYLGWSSAHAKRSASGSFANTSVELLRDAVASARFSVAFPSSGFGKRTVENSGSGFICSSTGMYGWKKFTKLTIHDAICQICTWNPRTSKTRLMYGAPTPWTGV